MCAPSTISFPIAAWAALVDGLPMAIFRCAPDDRLFAISTSIRSAGHRSLSRGIVGSVGDRSVVISPLYKQRFDLATGEALDVRAIVLPVHEVRCSRWSGAGRIDLGFAMNVNLCARSCRCARGRPGLSPGGVHDVVALAHA